MMKMAKALNLINDDTDKNQELLVGKDAVVADVEAEADADVGAAKGKKNGAKSRKSKDTRKTDIASTGRDGRSSA